MYTYKARLQRVVDGDTVDLIIDLGFDIHHKCRCRLYGINTPESRTKDLAEKELGLAAKAYVEDWFNCNTNCFVQTVKDGKGKYGRLLAKIYPDEKCEFSLNEQLVDSGHATEYFGGKR
jgi:micrococcal nuclease